MPSSCRWLALALLVLGGCTTGSPQACSMAAPHGPCEESGDCGADSSCEQLDWEYGAGGICTGACRNELDCASNGSRAGRCLAVAGGTFQCYSECTATGDCPGGWVCQPVSTGGGVCLP